MGPLWFLLCALTVGAAAFPVAATRLMNDETVTGAFFAPLALWTVAAALAFWWSRPKVYGGDRAFVTLTMLLLGLGVAVQLRLGTWEESWTAWRAYAPLLAGLAGFLFGERWLSPGMLARWLPRLRWGLWLAALGAVLSGVCLAHFRQELGHALWWRQLHIGCAYWLLVLCGLHFGLHIETLAAPLRQKMCFIKIRKVLPWLGAVLAAAGLWAGWRLAVEPALLFGSSFVPNGGSWYCFAAQAVAVFWLCAFAAYVFTRRKICK